MIPEKEKGETFLRCSKCGYKEKIGSKSGELKIVKEHEIKKTITIDEEKITAPITEKMCPKCGNTKAYYFLQQTRAADEPPTQFFKCKNCGYVWREY
jgi:DNA-directed RNA polymerase subunit M